MLTEGHSWSWIGGASTILTTSQRVLGSEPITLRSGDPVSNQQVTVEMPTSTLDCIWEEKVHSMNGLTVPPQRSSVINILLSRKDQ